MKTVLDFQLKEHEIFLQPFIRQFKNSDRDHDGILNETEFSNLMQALSIDRNEELLQKIDPYNN